MIITSNTNEKIKDIKKLYDKKCRYEEKKYIAEGIKILEEAYLNKQIISNIVICEEILNTVAIDKQVINKMLEENEEKIIQVSKNVFESICDTVTPQGILAVIEMEKNCIDEILSDNIIFLDSLQDAGNIGTIIRSARAFGFNTVILNKGCADIYNSKVIRASMGNIFKVKCYQCIDTGVNILNDLKQKEYVIYSTTLKDSKSIYEIEFSKKNIIIVGNEANGIMQEIIDKSDYNILIPMDNSTESLNAAVAASVVMAEIKKRG